VQAARVRGGDGAAPEEATPEALALELEATASETEGLRVATSIYPCSNPDCPTAIVVRSELGGGYLDADVALGRLIGAPARAFARGRWDRDGVWRDASGDARTAPVQRDLFGG
jgi:hypothetical protein